MKRLMRTKPWMPVMLLLAAIGLAGWGWWASQQVGAGVLAQRAGEAALNVNHLLSPPLPDLAPGAPLTSDHLARLQRLVGPTPLGPTIVAFKVWDPQGRILHSSLPALIGQTFPVKDELARAFRGEVVFDVSDLADTENTLERGAWDRLLEVYSPVQDPVSGEVTAVVELYQTVDALEQEARQAQTTNGLLFAGALGITYLLLAGTLRHDRSAVTHQLREGQTQAAQLAERLAQAHTNEARARHGAGAVAVAYEQTLRQLAAEWRAALRQLEGASESPRLREELALVVRSAVAEVEALAEKHTLPALDALTLAEVAEQAAGAPQPGGPVELDLGALPDPTPLAIKLVLYKFVQAGLAHARSGGNRQRVTVHAEEGALRVIIASRQDASASPAPLSPLSGGPGSSWPQRPADLQPGLVGGALADARHLVESVGGAVSLTSDPVYAVCLTADLPLPAAGATGW